MDYGTVWPVLLVLFTNAFIAEWRRPWQTLTTGTILAATLAPFVWYYELWGRLGFQQGTWMERFRLNVQNTNEYLIPLLILAAALIYLTWRWKGLPPIERRLVAISCGTILALGIWVPAMTTSAFLRYAIMAAPVACLISAWFLVRVVPNSYHWVIWSATAVLILAPWASMPLHLFVAPPAWYGQGKFLRSELLRMKHEIFENSVDVNREVIDWLRDNADPSDEILVNYADLPLMYYLPNPVRGGIAAFRATDDARTPPRFLVLRTNIPFVPWPVYLTEARRYRWNRAPVTVPSAIWGNNPDPMSALTPPHPPDVLILRPTDD
jgi:hypothetical protein